jgi:uncharacterized protein
VLNNLNNNLSFLDSAMDGSPKTDFHVLAKPIGPICDLNCRYCYYLEKEKLYPANRGLRDWTLPDNVLESYIRQYIQSQPTPTVSFAWQGGEPTLLGIDYFRRIVSLQQRHANGRRIENTLQTNGVLLDDRWGEFLARNQFLVGLSIDGPGRMHDRYRRDKGGAPTFDKVMRGLGYLKKHEVAFNTLTVVQKDNSQSPLEVYRFLKEIGSGYMQFIPVVERIAEDPMPEGIELIPPDSALSARLSEWSVDPMQFGVFYCAIFDEWVRNDVGKSFVQLFDVLLSAWVGMDPGLCIFRRTCGSALVMEHNGDMYSCDHYVYPENKLGNIMHQPLEELVNSPEQARFGQDKSHRLPRQCNECSFQFACNGACPKHRFSKTPSGEGNQNYLCPGYKRFFAHVAPAMEFMAAELRAERPPANVMAWIQNRDRGIKDRKQIGRNDPCPCGSGRKYKRCCGMI